jgi:hypothetical protein
MLQATFDIRNDLVQQGVLYSGYIRLIPDRDVPGVYPMTIPYQGFSRNYTAINVQPTPRRGHPATVDLNKFSRALCYAPGTRIVMTGRYMDSYSTVPDICKGGIATAANTTINVSLEQLRRFSDCALRITLAIEIPVRR